MASPPPPVDMLNRDYEFIQTSYLTYLIPLDTNFDLEKALEEHAGDPKAVFESIDDRKWFFFGMFISFIATPACRTSYSIKDPR